MLAENLILPIFSNLALVNTAARGIAIAVTGMLIVACALLLICLFITSLPKMLAAVATIWPESEEPHGAKKHAESLVLDDDSMIAAIGFVLHRRLHQQHGGPDASTNKT